MLVYDPRDNKTKESNNPALIVGYYIEQTIINSSLQLDNNFYRMLINEANYWDDKLSSLTIK